jgi:hypothetical protein
MSVPEPLELLFAWIEETGYVTEVDGAKVGSLFSDRAVREAWTATERPGGTDIRFAPGPTLEAWFGFGHARVSALGRGHIPRHDPADGARDRQVRGHMGEENSSDPFCACLEGVT